MTSPWVPAPIWPEWRHGMEWVWDMARKHGLLKTTTTGANFNTLPYIQKSLYANSIVHATSSFTCSCLLRPHRFADISPSNSRMVSSVSGNSYHTIIHQLHCWGDWRFRFKGYVTAAYGKLNGILNSKSWVKSLRSYHNVASSHRKRFPSTGPNSFEPIDEYLDTVWAHPTGPR